MRFFPRQTGPAPRADYVLCMARADYRHAASGLEKYLREEIELLARAGLSAVCVFPFRTRRNRAVDAWLSQYWGVVVDGAWRGFCRAADLAGWLADWRRNGRGLREIQLHHVQDYPLALLADFLAAVPAPVRLFIHDYHVVCAQYNLLRNGQVFCGPTAPSAEKCAGCRSWDPAYHPAWRAFLESLRGRLEIWAPSAAAERVVVGAFPEWAGHVRVVPHWRAVGPAAEPRPAPGETLKIAFVGAPSPAKGWDVFLRLRERLATRGASYEFIHFGRPARKGPARVRTVPVSVVRDGREAMTAALRKAGVDFVLLWSICPETFSYVLYECLQAGAMVLTHPDSGNVADEVRRSDVGIVLADERELRDYLADGARVRADVLRCRRESLARFGTMAVNEEILRWIPPAAAADLPARKRSSPARLVGGLYALKRALRRWGRAR
jgi:hypothetical protein